MLLMARGWAWSSGADACGAPSGRSGGAQGGSRARLAVLQIGARDSQALRPRGGGWAPGGGGRWGPGHVNREPREDAPDFAAETRALCLLATEATGQSSD